MTATGSPAPSSRSSTACRKETFAMKRAILAALAVVAGLLTGTTVASAANLLSNPGFESGLSGWTCSLGSAVSSPVHSGTAALSGAVTSSDFAQCTQTVTVVPSSTYSVSAWVKGSFVFLGITGGPSTDVPAPPSYTQPSLSFPTAPRQSPAHMSPTGRQRQGPRNPPDRGP